MATKTPSPMSDGGPVEIKRGDLRKFMATISVTVEQQTRWYERLNVALSNMPNPNEE